MAKRIWEIARLTDKGDGRKIDKEQLAQCMETFSGKRPISFGHDAAMGWRGDDAPAAGIFSKLSLSNDVLIAGDVDLTDEAEEAYNKGKYPTRSAGFSRAVTRDESGMVVNFGKWEVDHIAMLGAVPAYFTDLKDLETKEPKTFSKVSGDSEFAIYSKGDREYMIFSMTDEAIIKQQKENEMDIKELQDNFSKAQAVNAELTARLASLEAENKASKKALYSSKLSDLETAAISKGIRKDSDLFKKIEAAHNAAIANFDKTGEVNLSAHEAFAAMLDTIKPAVEVGRQDFSKEKSDKEDDEERAFYSKMQKEGKI